MTKYNFPYRVYDHNGILQKPNCEAKTEHKAQKAAFNFLADNYGGLGCVEIFTPKGPRYYKRMDSSEQWTGPSRVNPFDYSA